MVLFEVLSEEPGDILRQLDVLASIDMTAVDPQQGLVINSRGTSGWRHREPSH